MEFVCFICPLKVHSKVYAVLLSEIITILQVEALKKTCGEGLQMCRDMFL